MPFRGCTAFAGAKRTTISCGRWGRMSRIGLGPSEPIRFYAPENAHCKARPMYGYRRAGWENALAGDAALLLVILFILVIAVVVTIIVATVLEIGRIAQRSANYRPETRRVIRWSIGGIVAVAVLCGVMPLLIPALVPGTVYATAWGFLLLVVVIETCDWYERQQESDVPKALGDLDTYLDFASTATEESSQGSANGTVERAPIGALQ